MTAFAIIKGVVGLACLALFFYQVHISFGKLKSKDVISISETVSQDEFDVPGIRFCHEIGSFFNITVPKNMSEIYKMKQPMNETILGTQIGYFNSYFTIKSVHDMTTTPEQWTEDSIPIFYGEGTEVIHQQVDCYSLEPGNLKTALGTTAGVQIYVNVSKSREQGYHILYISDPGNSFFSSKVLFGTGIQVMDLSQLDLANKEVLSSTTYSIHSTLRKKLFMKDKYECLEDGKDTLNYCFEKYLVTTMKCRSPFHIGFDNFPICSTSSQLEKLKGIFSMANYSSLKLSFFMNDLSCQLPCQYKEYKIEPITDVDYPCAFTEGCKDLLLLQIVSRSDQYDIVTEKWLYDEANFIADVGGYLGLLLGVSVLTLLDYMRIVANEAQKLIKMRKNQ